MSGLSPLHWKKLECVFFQLGFKFERQKGSHRSYSKPGVARPIIIQKIKEVSVSNIMSNIRTAGITREKFLELLKNC